jgi:uncharacterized protein with HEPN domain
MKAPRSATDFLNDVVAAGERCLGYVKGMTEQQFMADERTRDPSLRDRFPEFEADAAYAMRNILTHGYFKVDAEILWRTAKNSVVKIVADARNILAQQSSP